MSKKNIVVAGAGFGGITAALQISKWIKKFPEYNLVLLNKRGHHLYTPALYEIAAIPSSRLTLANLKLAAMVPISDIVLGKTITFICDEIIKIDADKKEIALLRNGKLAYEYLILALGSETNYFDMPGMKEHGLSLKTFEDAVRMRDAIEAEVMVKDEIKVVVGGGGASGVEVIAEFVNFIQLLKKRIKVASSCQIKFTLIEAGPDILAGFEPWMVIEAKKRLRKLGVEIKTNLRIKSVEPKKLYLDNGAIETFDLLFWMGGVKGPEILKNSGFSVSPKGALEIDEYLRVKNHTENVFAIGDNSSFINPKTGKPLTWNVPIAEAEGRLVAKNILLSLEKKPLKKFQPMGKYPYILAVGKKFAIADLIFLRISGTTGWCLKQIVELRYLLFILSLPRAIEAWFRAVRASTSND